MCGFFEIESLADSKIGEKISKFGENDKLREVNIIEHFRSFITRALLFSFGLQPF